MPKHFDRRNVTWILALLACCAGTGRGSAAEEKTEQPLLTVAERSEYRATSRHDEVQQFLTAVAKRSENVRLIEFGETVEGRPLSAVIVARPPVGSPDALRQDKRLVVLLLGNIHSGECAGKESLLMLLRELALESEHRWLKGLVLMVVPNFNADANERVGKAHRPGQVGPVEGMGRRENAQELDLNRDFVKLETPEVRALVKLVDAWDPHLLIDTHTTNGSWHRYRLTYAVPHNPATPAAIRTFLWEKMMPAVTEQLQSRGVDTFFYGNFNAEHTRWSTFDYRPCFGTEYIGLRGRLAILAEAHAYIPYKDRIEATRAFVGECLTYAAAHQKQIRRLLRKEDRRVTQSGREPKVGDEVPVRAEVVAFPKKVVIKGYQPDSIPKDKHQVTGEQRKGLKPKDHTVEFYGKFRTTHKVQRAFAYLVPKEAGRLVDRLRMHGIPVEQLAEEASLEVDVYRVDKSSQAGRTFQRHRLRTLEVTARREQRTVAEGTYVVPTGHALGNLVACLLEPAAADGLAAWNFLDHVLKEGEDYPILRVPVAVELKTKAVEQVEPAALLSLDAIYGPSGRVPFGRSASVSARWLPDSTTYVKRIRDKTAHVDAATGAYSYVDRTDEAAKAFAALPAISESDARGMAGGGTRSPDREAILVTRANDLFYYRYGSEQAIRLTSDPAREQSPTFSPDGTMVAFVRDHNLYVVETETGRERALTTAGTAELLHGRLDWSYQEELYGRGNYKAFWWSPDSSRLALLRLDLAAVKKYTVADNIPYRQSLEVWEYPKAGDPLPQVSLGVVKAAGGDVRWIEDYEYSAADKLLVRVGWSGDSRRVVYQVQNRAQTWLDLRSADPSSGKSSLLFRETSPGWVDVLGDPRWLKDGAFLWESERSGHRHIYLVTADGKQVKPITKGPWNVRSVYGIDPDRQWIYFSATKDSAIETHGYRVKLDGAELTRLTQSGASHSLRFDDSLKYFLDFRSSIGVPIKVELYGSDGTFVRAVAPNLADHLPYFKLGRPEFLEVPTRDGGTMQAMLIKPPDFDPQKKYPVLCHVYGGPQMPTVFNRWRGSSHLWHQMFAQRGYCIWLCDNRSASSRGIKHAYAAHLKLGQTELRDIEDGLAWLKKHAWIDPERIGIWGWSYGGYMTGYALTHSKSFRVGIAGAPVTDWRNYDAIYTERYMGLPQQNPDGYKAASVTAAAADLHGHLLLIHGSQDENVHLGNTLQLAYELQKAKKQFDLMIYPKNRHGISRPGQSRHLRELMTRFILDRL